ncbi:hypothetical protein [Curtobacterium sp. VKM Ac-1376]|uniref:hypothetical protein n=1 Tax=Curtobacterium sp. VKM Ac-1376 TaxID=123312 RepID=UPI00188CB46F|nr:hypothetical protein [Curtobacterium sp. VKM Ac-1376]MBF4615181.1 hypothetical protein [Curtobacterium sp. VKM Ac-1376]
MRSAARKAIFTSTDTLTLMFQKASVADRLLSRLRSAGAGASTSSAAAMVGTGEADMAVCNDEARRQQDLTWFRVRNGVPIVWMLFGNNDEGESGSTRIHREER